MFDVLGQSGTATFRLALEKWKNTQPSGVCVYEGEIKVLLWENLYRKHFIWAGVRFKSYEKLLEIAILNYLPLAFYSVF